MADRARYDGTTGEPGVPKKPGNFDQGELQGYFGHLYDRDLPEIERLTKERDTWRTLAQGNSTRVASLINENRELRRGLADC